MNESLAPAPKEAGREMGVQVAAKESGLKEHQAGVPDCRRPSEQREHHTREQRLDPEQEERAGQRREGEQGYQMRADEEGVTDKFARIGTVGGGNAIQWPRDTMRSPRDPLQMCSDLEMSQMKDTERYMMGANPRMKDPVLHMTRSVLRVTDPEFLVKDSVLLMTARSPA
jgi:hypothetical protein